MTVSKAWFLAKPPGVNGLMQVRIYTMYITYKYKIKCQGKTDEEKTTVEIVKNMQKTWRIFCQTRQVDWQPELTCSCGHLCSACLFLTTKEKIKLKYFITVEKKNHHHQQQQQILCDVPAWWTLSLILASILPW